MVRDAEQDEVRKCTPFVFGHRLVVARTAWKGAAYVGNLDVDDRLVSDKADNWGAAVREIAGALGERVECRPGARGVTVRPWGHE